MSSNIFGPDPARGGTTGRPARSIIANVLDHWFNICASPSDPAATFLVPDFFNSLIGNLRRLPRTAGVTDDEASDDLLAQAVARYGSIGTFGLDVGTANTYVLQITAPFLAPSSLFLGLRCRFRPGNPNTGASTVNPFGLGARALLRPDGSALQKGDLDGSEIEIEYDPTAAGGAGGHKLMPWSLVVQAPGRLEGYLCLRNAAAGGPGFTGDITAATAVYYSSDVGNGLPIWNGSRFVRRTFSELTLALVSAHLASTIYDAWVFDVAGVLVIGTGSAWSNSGAGAGARGTGGTTTELARVGGVLVNANAMTMRNGASTYAVPAGYATLVGSLKISAVAGQINCHVTPGQSREWGVANIQNHRPIVLQVVDPTPTWAYASATIRQSNGAAGNKATAFCALPDRGIVIEAAQDVQLGNNAFASIGIGVDSTTSYSSKHAHVTAVGAPAHPTTFAGARHRIASLLGSSNISLNESAASGTSSTFFGAVAQMLMTVSWMG